MPENLSLSSDKTAALLVLSVEEAVAEETAELLACAEDTPKGHYHREHKNTIASKEHAASVDSAIYICKLFDISALHSRLALPD